MYQIEEMHRAMVHDQCINLSPCCVHDRYMSIDIDDTSFHTHEIERKII